MADRIYPLKATEGLRFSEYSALNKLLARVVRTDQPIEYLGAIGSYGPTMVRSNSKAINILIKINPIDIRRDFLAQEAIASSIGILYHIESNAILIIVNCSDESPTLTKYEFVDETERAAVSSELETLISNFTEAAEV